MIYEFREHIPVTTPLGDGYAIFVDSDEWDNHWTVVLDDGSFVTFRQEQITAWRDYTRGRGITDAEMREKLGQRS